MTKEEFIKKYGEVIRMTVPLLLPEFEQDVNDLVDNVSQKKENYQYSDPDDMMEPYGLGI